MLPTFEQVPVVAPKHHQFEFTVTGLSNADAERLMSFIREEIEYYASTLAGGFAEVNAEGEAVTE